MILADRFHYSKDFLQRCSQRLDFALQSVPFYRAWRSRDQGSEVSLDERYDALPVLDKAAMRAAGPAGLVPAGQDLAKALEDDTVEYTFTSGTTSEKVVNIFDQSWWSRSERASWKLNRHLAALPYPQKTAKLASSLNVGVNCEEDLPMASRMLGATLYLNEKTTILQWQQRHLQRMASELSEFQPVLLEANPSLLARLANWALDHGVELYAPQAIVFTYEFSSAVSLRAIRRAFPGVPFVSSYGTTESGFVLEECEDGFLHQNTDFCRIDFQPLKPQFGGPEVGRIYVTTFDNPWNVIVRFDAGDLVRLHPAGQCACGRAEGMIVDAVEGRLTNSTFTTRGALVSSRTIDAALAEIPELRDYHLEQTGRASYELPVMLSDRSPRVLASLQNVLKRIYGADGIYHIAPLDNLLPGPAGKFRRTQANFDFDPNTFF